jgi:hypothetical protein
MTSLPLQIKRIWCWGVGGGGVQEKQNTQSKEKLGEREGDSYAMSETPLELMEDWQQERLSKRLSS